MKLVHTSVFNCIGLATVLYHLSHLPALGCPHMAKNLNHLPALGCLHVAKNLNHLPALGCLHMAMNLSPSVLPCVFSSCPSLKDVPLWETLFHIAISTPDWFKTFSCPTSSLPLYALENLLIGPWFVDSWFVSWGLSFTKARVFCWMTAEGAVH